MSFLAFGAEFSASKTFIHRFKRDQFCPDLHEKCFRHGCGTVRGAVV
jgi:hypothetical protein